MRTKVTSLAVAVVGFAAWAALTLPASAQPGLSQTDTLALQIPTIPEQEFSVCINDECTVVPVPGGGSELRIALNYAINPSADLPGIDVSAPFPAACVLPDGRSRAGGAISVTGANFATGSTITLAVWVGGEEVGKVEAPAESHEAGEPLAASVCTVAA